MRPLILLLLLVLTFNIAYAQKQQHYSRAKIYLDASGHSIRDLSALGIAVDHGQYKKNTFFISDFSDTELETVKVAGFKVDIIIADVVKHYQDQNKKKAQKNNYKTTSVSCSNSPAISVPAHFHLGTYGGYFTYNEMITIIDSMQLLYPGLISVKQPIDTFHSIQGRPIYWIRISNNPSVDQPAKPQMLVTALHHAREPGSLSATIFYLWYLLEHYSTDPHIKTIIDNTELYFVPCVNPDGYLDNITNYPSGGGMMRKNMRDNLDGTFGVDLNRNYGYYWGYDNIGSSPVTSYDTYRGTAGFSEPETQAIKWFAEHHHFKLNLNYHTYHNDILYPWNYIPTFQTVDSEMFFKMGQFLTQYNSYRFGTCNQMLGYISNGASDDWMYGDTSGKPKVYAMTPEIGSYDNGFYPPDYQIIPDCENNLLSNINAASLLLPFASIHHTDKKILIQPSGYLHYDLQRLGFPDTATFTLTIVPLDAFMTVSPTPKVYTGLSMQQKIHDSMAYTIIPSAPNGQLISYALKVYNGYYYIYDTVLFYYGKEYSITTPSTASLTDWINNGWGVCTSSYYTPPSSIQSSLSGSDPYLDAEDITISTAHPADLTYATQAYLNFYAKWAIETDYDSVMVNAAIDGTANWAPLCGRRTIVRHTGSIPLYDGQEPNWVQEEMDLHDYIGHKINIQFELGSDLYNTDLGYYFDDVSITAVLDTPLGVHNTIPNVSSLQVYPNPAHDLLNISVTGSAFNQPLNAILYDCLGREVMSFTIDKPNVTINVQQLPVNVYYLKVYGNGQVLPVQKVNVLK
ncbi:MAG: M14 family zinc carboxypeptidase [Chitinophagales bacterium]